MKSDNNYNFKLKEVAPEYGFKETNMHDGESIIYGCSFWETKYNGILISDWDVRDKINLRENNCASLFGYFKTKNNRKGFFSITISNEVLDDKDEFNSILDGFYTKIEDLKN